MESVRVRAFAKINLSLEVLNRRPDGFHNLRTIFQTISLADVIEVHVAHARRTRIEIESNVTIPGTNLVSRAAEAVLDAAGKRAFVRFVLRKRIPMGGGLGGGSTNAAAVLMTLPRLIGAQVERERLVEIGAALGSDVPFFLAGGTALGLGRGTELYPLQDAPSPAALLVAPQEHVSTAEAYGALRRTNEIPAGAVNFTERLAQALAAGLPSRAWPCVNDFEREVLTSHPAIAAIRSKLLRLGARPAMMTGSGAAVFGLFESAERRDAAAARFASERVYRISFVNRRRYLAEFARFGTGVL